jgi:hypothetical protein
LDILEDNNKLILEYHNSVQNNYLSKNQSILTLEANKYGSIIISQDEMGCLSSRQPLFVQD